MQTLSHYSQILVCIAVTDRPAQLDHLGLAAPGVPGQGNE